MRSRLFTIKLAVAWSAAMLGQTSMRAGNPEVVLIDRPPAEVQQEIVQLFKAASLQDYRPIDKIHADSYLKKYYFIKPDTEHDVYFESFSYTRFYGESEVYYYGGKKSRYYADFIFQVREKSPMKTALSVVAVEPEASKGRMFNIHTFHLSEYVVRVKPTGYEEYVLALKVAKRCGVQGLPEPVIPPRVDLD